MQQQKTTVVHIGAMWWTTEQPVVSGENALLAELAVAICIAEQCHMDILSITHHDSPSQLVTTTVVYLSNGVSMHDIVERMRPEINKKSGTYWMLMGMEEWQGLLDCTVCIRGIHEEWEA